MSCTYEKLSSNKAKLSFTVSAEEFDAAVAKAYKKNVSRINIPGFRRGKAPRHVIEMHYGKGVFYEDALDDLFPDLYQAAVKENELEPVDRPELDVEQMEAGKELKFSVEVFVRPDVTLGDYKNIQATREVSEVTDDDVNAEIERARERNARFIDITDRPARLDDEVDIDYEGWDGDVSSRGAYITGNVPLGKSKCDIVGSYDYFNFNTDLYMDQHKAIIGLQYWFFHKCRLQVQYVYKSAYTANGAFIHGSNHAVMCQMQIRLDYMNRKLQ